MMGIQTFYPVFEDGQVLTSRRLNDIVDYLEPQTRLSRSQLIGIGIVCGLRIDWRGDRLHVSKGVAVTSEGYLIVEGDVSYDRARAYRVPVPSAPDATSEEKAAARYPYLFDGNTQREAFELLPVGFDPAPGAAQPVALSDAFVADKAVVLFLERNRESLKTCDVNDCADKGSEMNLTLRRLLVSRQTADRMLQQEQDVTDGYADRASHPRQTLTALDIDKINPSGNAITSYAELGERIVETGVAVTVELQVALRKAYEVYSHLLRDEYPQSDFPAGPVPDAHFLNLWASWAHDPALAQYLHAGLHDMVRSLNEFLNLAARFDAECSPAAERFPLHVLVGDVDPRATAFSGAPLSLEAFDTYDPLAAAQGPVIADLPRERRHAFVPSPVVADGGSVLAELRAVFARTLLLTQTFYTRGRLSAPIRITPSRDGVAKLGMRAIPFYYRFDEDSDLFGNWSWPRSSTVGSDRVHAYHFTLDRLGGHPNLQRRDGEDFLRVEGVVGKPLGTTLYTLIEQRRRLGLSFAIDPVYLRYGLDDEKAERAARNRANDAIAQLLLCRLRDLDVIFAMLMAAIFALMVWLVQALGRLAANKTTRPDKAVVGGGRETIPTLSAVNTINATAAFTTLASARGIRLDRDKELELQAVSDDLRYSLNKGGTSRETLIKEVAGVDTLEPIAVAAVYDRVRDERAGGELIDRVRVASKDLDLGDDSEAAVRQIYPSIALMARAEEVMQAASAPTVAEFDPERFDTAISGFADAFDAYVDVADTDEATAGKDAAAVNRDIIGRRDEVTAMARLGGSVIMSELQKRTESMFDEMTFERYVQRHAGIEHRGGVPVGGTLVLAYADRDLLAEGIRAALDRSVPRALEVFAKLLGVRSPDFDVDRIVKELLTSSQPQSDDILDQFIVLGDFCLPYNCCENDCSDRQVEQRLGDKGTAIADFGRSGLLRAGGGEVSPANDGTSGTVRTGGGVIVQPGGGAGTGVRVDDGSPATGGGLVSDGRTDSGLVAARQGKLTGAVFSRQSSGRESAVRTAILALTDTSTNKTIKQQLTESEFSLSLPPGKYTLQATLRDRRSNRMNVTIVAGRTADLRVVIV